MDKWEFMSVAAAVVAVGALICGISVATIHSDDERTKQIEACSIAGGSFISGSPTQCIGGGSK